VKFLNPVILYRIMHLRIRLIATAIYIIGDIAYVMASSPVYTKAAIKVSGLANIESRTTTRIAVSAVAAWTCMALGWYFFAAPVALSWVPKVKSRLLAGILAGLVWGLVIVGTFNFTIAAMFQNWSANIMARDIAWGIFWSIATLTAYVYVARGSSK